MKFSLKSTTACLSLIMNPSYYEHKQDEEIMTGVAKNARWQEGACTKTDLAGAWQLGEHTVCVRKPKMSLLAAVCNPVSTIRSRAGCLSMPVNVWLLILPWVYFHLVKTMHEWVMHFYSYMWCLWQVMVKAKTNLVCVFEMSVCFVPLTLWCIEKPFECLLMLCFVICDDIKKCDL